MLSLSEVVYLIRLINIYDIFKKHIQGEGSGITVVSKELSFGQNSRYLYVDCFKQSFNFVIYIYISRVSNQVII